MDTTIIEQDFRFKVCEQITLQRESTTRYRVFSPFQFDDGDHLIIVLQQIGENWYLTDEGHTYMHLTYYLDEKDLRHGTRQVLIGQALSMFGVSDQDGELIMEIPDQEFGGALYAYIQAILKITDVTYLSRERVFSTFMEDFYRFFEELIPAERIKKDWHDPNKDKNGNYQVDLLINQMDNPLFIYAIINDNKARDTTISLLKFETWNYQFHSIAIFENQEEISRPVLARLSDVCEKQFSSLYSNKERIQIYVNSLLPGLNEAAGNKSKIK